MARSDQGASAGLWKNHNSGKIYILRFKF